jgi:hypothetical protein
MGWSYRKTFKFGPLRINVSRHGIGTSLGIRGFRITHSSTGKRYVTLTMPGTGLSWRKTFRRGRPSGKLPIQPSPISGAPSPVPTNAPPPTGQSSAPSLPGGTPWWKQTGITKGP